MAKSFFDKEQTKIRRKLNRHRRRITRQVLSMCHCDHVVILSGREESLANARQTSRQSLYIDDPKILTFKNTSGWLTW